MVQGTTTYGYSCLGLDSLIKQTTFDDTISDTMLSGVSFYLFVISVSLSLSLSLSLSPSPSLCFASPSIYLSIRPFLTFIYIYIYIYIYHTYLDAYVYLSLPRHVYNIESDTVKQRADRESCVYCILSYVCLL